MWLSGNYPRALDGLTRILSLDMRVMDPAWIGMKLRKLLDYPEPSATSWPSCPAPAAAELAVHRGLHRRLIIHRYAMLGVLDENGYPKREMGILKTPATAQRAQSLMQGALCNDAATTR